jgi:hypothetical protein
MREYYRRTLSGSLALTFAAAVLAIAAEDENGFKPLFNGKDLTGWVYNKRAPRPAKPKPGQKSAPESPRAPVEQKSGAGYQVENGVVYCTVKDGGMLFTEEDYGDFILRFEFKIEENSNNGIGIRVPLGGHPSADGMEIQILDDNGSKHQKLRETQFHGSIYDVVPAKRGHLKPVGEWNSEEIRAEGRRIKVTLNGHVIVDANLDDIKDDAVLKKHPGLQSKTGRIALCGHGTRVEFRNMRIKGL